MRESVACVKKYLEQFGLTTNIPEQLRHGESGKSKENYDDIVAVSFQWSLVYLLVMLFSLYVGNWLDISQCAVGCVSQPHL